MNKIFKLLATLLLFAAPSFAQDARRQYVVINTTPDTGLGVGTISYHQLSWSKVGTVSVCSVKLQQSTDNSTWSDLIASQDCSTSGQSSVTNITANFVRIDPTSFTGSGSVIVNWSGWVNNPASGGTPTLNQVLDPTADKTFAMGAHLMELDGTGGGSFDGSPASLVINTATGGGSLQLIIKDSSDTLNQHFASIQKSNNQTFTISPDEFDGSALAWSLTPTPRWIVNGAFQSTGDVGFFATAPAAKQTVTGSKGGNAALASLLTALATYGLITDSST